MHSDSQAVPAHFSHPSALARHLMGTQPLQITVIRGKCKTSAVLTMVHQRAAAWYVDSHYPDFRSFCGVLSFRSEEQMRTRFRCGTLEDTCFNWSNNRRAQLFRVLKMFFPDHVMQRLESPICRIHNDRHILFVPINYLLF